MNKGHLDLFGLSFPVHRLHRLHLYLSGSRSMSHQDHMGYTGLIHPLAPMQLKGHPIRLPLRNPLIRHHLCRGHLDLNSLFPVG